MNELVWRLFSAESWRRGTTYAARDTDVIIATFPKTGTTWVQQICHQVRTGGDTAFEDIAAVVPYMERMWDCGQDADADQGALPRLFKTHVTSADHGAACRYVHTLREPGTALCSLASFLAQREPDRPALADPDALARDALWRDGTFDGNIWDTYVDFWRRRDDPRRLVVVFEDLLADLDGQLRRIARFLRRGGGAAVAGVEPDGQPAVEPGGQPGVEPDGQPAVEPGWDRIRTLCGFAWMREHQDKFDSRWSADRQRALGRAPSVIRPAAKVSANAGRPHSRDGRDGHDDHGDHGGHGDRGGRGGHGGRAGRAGLSAGTRTLLDEAWRDRVTAVTGHATYEAFARAVIADSRA